ncbi:MAG: hypothetical protein M3445_04690 [Actinomycetota bacterium]|nr:hypothetical protein [Actinomycetota bacterium]
MAQSRSQFIVAANVLFGSPDWSSFQYHTFNNALSSRPSPSRQFIRRNGFVV